MPITKAESKKIRQLAEEGKQTSSIRRDHLPHLRYKEIAEEVEKWDQKSAQGRMRMITTRLNDIANEVDQAKRLTMSREILGLSKEMYKNYRLSHTKLTAIRETLDK